MGERYTSLNHLLRHRAKLLQDAQRLPEHAGRDASLDLVFFHSHSPATLLHRGKKVQTMRVLGRHFLSFLFQGCALQPHQTEASK